MATEKNTLELYFEWWLNEIKEAGFIKEYKREALPIQYIDEMKLTRYNFSTKTPKIEEFKLLGKSVYNCDYIIIWNTNAKELFYNLLDDKPTRIWCPFYAMIDAKGEHITLCDVKPTSEGAIKGNMISGFTFPIIQKIIYKTFGIYVNKAIPIPMVSRGKVKSGNNVSLFTTTFVPKRYLLTDGGGQARTIHYRKNTLKEYITYKVKEIDRINALFTTQGKLL